jgi:non-ribosomal peptide synthetase component F
MAAAQLAILLENHHGGASETAGAGGEGALTQTQQRHPLASLRLVSCGGSSVTPGLVRKLWAAAPRATYFTDYGVTEAGGWVCSSLMLPSEEAVAARLPVDDRARLLAGSNLHSPSFVVLAS